MKHFESIGFGPADILLPRNADLNKWCVVACDQYTSEPDYWEKAAAIVGDAPSTLNLVFPEIYLEEPGFDQRISSIQCAMNRYLDSGVFVAHPQAFILTRRTQADGKVRTGLIGAVDLEQYALEDLESRVESHRTKTDSLKTTMDAENARMKAIRSLSDDSNTFQDVYKRQEYGSARWGTHEDIAPYIDPVFQNLSLIHISSPYTVRKRNGKPWGCL